VLAVISLRLFFDRKLFCSTRFLLVHPGFTLHPQSISLYMHLANQTQISPKILKSKFLEFCENLYDHLHIYTVSQKKGDTILLSISLLNIDRFLQRISTACYAERCNSHSKSVRPSVRLSVCPTVCPSHAGTVSKPVKLRSCGLHWRIAP